MQTTETGDQDESPVSESSSDTLRDFVTQQRPASLLYFDEEEGPFTPVKFLDYVYNNTTEWSGDRSREMRAYVSLLGYLAQNDQRVARRASTALKRWQVWKRLG
jgi:hypothetical protein